ncbi:MAG: cadherin domain-containing protein, partial [Lacisediminimonas sp.]|nr:cadherin domain-containing protein [Lacisediminimonas sp.]
TAINENSGAGQVVYTATSTDAGDIATGSTSYSLKPATGDVAAFSINSATGAVTLTGNPNYETKSSYTFTVVATDAAGNASEKVVTLAVNNLDEVAPTISSSTTATAINENSGAGQVVYTATSTDAGDVATGSTSYSLKAATGDVSAFSINGSTGAVTLLINPDYEGKSTYTFTVVATDAAGHFSEKEVSLQVSDVNESPTTLTIDSSSINENVVAGSTIGSFASTDPDTGDTFTYSLVSGPGSTDNASFSIDGNALTINGSPNFEADSSYSIRVRTTDQDGLSFEQTFTVGVTDLNENPTAVNLSSTSITEGNVAGATVSTLTVTDQDGAGSGFAGPFTYELVSGAGDTDNAAFTITGSTLTINGVANIMEQSTYSIRIKVTDAGGNTYETTKTIFVTDVNDAPTLTASTTTATYTEDGAAVSLFSGASASTADSGQAISRLDFTITNVADAAAERLVVDGSEISLVAGTGTTSANGLTYTVSISEGTATVSLSIAGGIAESAAA